MLATQYQTQEKDNNDLGGEEVVKHSKFVFKMYFSNMNIISTN